MGIKRYVGAGLVTLALAGSLLLGGCYNPQLLGHGGVRPDSKLLGLEQRISQEVAQPNGQPDKYAVLIFGSYEITDRLNLSLVYDVLLENGFQRDNIYILAKETEKFFLNPDGTPLYPVDGISRKDNIEAVFDHLRNKVDDQDLLFVYFAPHGNRLSKIVIGRDGIQRRELSTLVIPGPDLDQREFSQYLQGIAPKTGVFLFEQCYGGGFAEEVGRGNYLAIAASAANEPSGSTIDDTFSHYFMLAFRDMLNSDSNHDGRVSVSEAFEYAKNNHKQTKEGKQKPFILGEIDADKVFLE